MDFLQSFRFLQAFEENNVSGPQVYPHIDFCVDCEQNNFSELEKLIFCKASVFFKLLRKTMFQVPGLPTYGFWVEWKQSKHARKKQFFGA